MVGLTLAEVFILLVFLLLLLTLMLYKEPTEEQKQDLYQELVIELTKAHDALNGETKAKPFTPKEIIETLRTDAEAYREKYKEKITELTHMQDQLSQTSRERDVLRKGENPPCWYKIVSDDREGTREKRLYLLNIAIEDHGLIVLRHQIPSGGAIDDGGRSYQEEAEELGLDRIRYGQLLKDKEFLQQVQHIYDSGQQKKVRTYPCVFSVRVWDLTSRTAKSRWQQAHDRTLEAFFSTYTMRDVPWPGWDSNMDGRISCAEARQHDLASISRDHPAYPHILDNNPNKAGCGEMLAQ